MDGKEMTLGGRLRAVRERAGLSQGELETASGVALSLISRYERDVVTPMWQQVERLLSAMNMTPCDLFSDMCERQQESGADVFSVPYFDYWPPDDKAPSEILKFRKSGPLTGLLSIAATDNRYVLVRAGSDMMIPDIYPGDLVICDKTLMPKAGKVAAGFMGDEPMVGRIVRHRQEVFIVPSNRRYPAAVFEPTRWNHRGCIIFSVRDLARKPLSAARFEDEPSDVMSVEELRSRGGRHW